MVLKELAEGSRYREIRELAAVLCRVLEKIEMREAKSDEKQRS